MRKSILVACVIVLAFCFLLIFRATQQQKVVLSANDNAPINQPSQPQQSQPVVNRQDSNNSRIIPLPPTVTPFVKALALTNPAAATRLALWQAPIDFYGKVVDENSNAVAGANITFNWTEIPNEEGNRTSTVNSDAEGLFSLHDARGPSLSISFSKDGYYSSHEGQLGFKYAFGKNILPDPRNPVIFLLHKKGQGVDLVTSENGMRLNVAVRIPKDNTPVRLDFFQKKASATGQLEISQNKPPWQGATNWSFTLTIPDGGLVENQDDFQFEASPTGYQSLVEYNFALGDPNWTTHVSKQFYIVFGEPRKYGWIRFESDLAQETVFVTYAINPSGSRNLEPAH